MSNQPLEGRVAIITGSSRGIGRAFAHRLAREGADIVVTGKTEQSTDKLPGSIYSVAEEVENLGRRTLPVRVDVRFEEEVKDMVEKTMETFGRLDILVNNAGAMWWERVLDTPPKRYDLMWQINVRAAYLCTYYALEHMIENKWGHIVNLSPPITPEANPGHTCYMTTKMGMTRLAMGVAAEHKDDNVAANSLWAATPIESQATINWGSDKLGGRHQWRSPEIYCDALMEILKNEPRDFTERQLVDESFLRERGWSQEQIDSYWCGDRPPEDPIWIDGREGALM